MKFSVEKDQLVKALTIAQGVISSRTNLPILANVLIKSDGGSGITITSTDLDIGVRVSVPAEVSSEGGISINSKKLFDFVREMETDSLEFVVKKNYHVHISSGSVSARFYGIPEEEFPALPSVSGGSSMEISAEVLKNVLHLTLFAASRDTIRYELNGVLFELEPGSIRAVASDGKRLSLAEVESDHDTTRSVIVPLKAGQELMRFLSDADVVSAVFGDNMVGFSWNGVELVSRVIEGEYPQYRRVIPDEKEEKAVIPRSSLLSALKRASIFTSTDSHAVKLDFYRNKLVITKDSQEVGSSREELPMSYEGEEISIGVNPDFLIDMLRTVPLEEVKVEVTAPDVPIVIRDTLSLDGVDYRYMYVVSLMRM